MLRLRLVGSLRQLRVALGHNGRRVPVRRVEPLIKGGKSLVARIRPRERLGARLNLAHQVRVRSEAGETLPKPLPLSRGLLSDHLLARIGLRLDIHPPQGLLHASLHALIHRPVEGFHRSVTKLLGVFTKSSTQRRGLGLALGLIPRGRSAFRLPIRLRATLGDHLEEPTTFGEIVRVTSLTQLGVLSPTFDYGRVEIATLARIVHQRPNLAGHAIPLQGVELRRGLGSRRLALRLRPATLGRRLCRGRALILLVLRHALNALSCGVFGRLTMHQ